VNLLFPWGTGRYTVNGMPIGPERAAIMQNALSSTARSLPLMPNLMNIGAANNTDTLLDQAFSTSTTLLPYQFTTFDESATFFAPITEAIDVSLTQERPAPFLGPDNSILLVVPDSRLK